MRYSIIIFCILLASCNPCKRLAKRCPVHDSISYVEVIKEDPAYTIPDSAYFSLEFYCDSTYEVLLRDYEEVNTSGIRTEVLIRDTIIYRKDKTSLKRLKVNIGVFTDSIKILNRTIEKIKSEQTTITVEKEVPVKYVPEIYKWSLGILILIILGFARYIYIKIKGFPLKK